MSDFDVSMKDLGDGCVAVDVSSPFCGYAVGRVTINGKEFVPGDLSIRKIVLTVEPDKPVTMNLECNVPQENNGQ